MDIIRIPEDTPQVSTLVDLGATSSFIDQTFIAQHNIPVVKKSTPIPVEVIDGRTIAFGAITHKTTLLTTLICKDKPFSWNPMTQAAFDTNKMAFTSAPILIHLDPAKPFIVETDALDFALGAILSQFGIDGLLHPVAFYPRKLTSAEINY